MTSRECFKNKWFYMKYIGKYLSVEILLTRECSIYDPCSSKFLCSFCSKMKNNTSHKEKFENTNGVTRSQSRRRDNTITKIPKG